ncbi:MAG TPA: hypothetical protein VMW02_02645 [Thermoplasmata archaeon]|nr:hypothetical protein [Thermoplasmata archaeon]
MIKKEPKWTDYQNRRMISTTPGVRPYFDLLNGDVLETRIDSLEISTAI